MDGEIPQAAASGSGALGTGRMRDNERERQASAVHAATTQVDANAAITDPHGDQVTLIGVNTSQLTSNNVKIGWHPGKKKRQRR